jgi:hypothetical protein
MGGVVGENFERQRMQAVPGEHRRGLAERLVDGRLAAPEVIIVHARQVVVDQAVDVDALDRGAGAKGAVLGQAEQARCRNGKHRAKALAATDRGMAHCLEQ